MFNQTDKVESLEPGLLTPFELNHLLNAENVQPLLIDVREANELAIAPFSFKVLHLPLSNSSEWIDSLVELLPSDRKIVVICHAGIRSLNFASWLMNQFDHLDVWNLEGGIDAWSVNIDHSIPRY